MRRLALFNMIFVVFWCVSTAQADWSRFRGPNGSGISKEDVATPVSWSPDKLTWKVALPGAGSSCPIVVGEKLFVTCWSGYGLDRGSPGDQQDLRRHLVCLDAATGKILWSKAVLPYLPEDQYGGMFAEHGYASHTPVSDGTNVFAFFGKTGVIAFDLEGKQVWQQSVGTESGARNWGTASSPLLFEDLVIVPATAESESVVALDKKTGEEVWRAEAAGFNSTWGSPVLVPVNDDRTDLVIAIPGEVWGLNARTGKLAWYADAISSSSFCSSVVADDNGVVYAVESGPGGGGGIAIRAGGKKDVSDSHVLWSNRQSSRIVTPLVYGDRIYLMGRSVVTCLDADSGEEVYRERLRSSGGTDRAEDESAEGRSRRGGRGGRGGQDYGSPVMADGKIYFTSRGGETFVFGTGDKFEQLAANRVTADREDFSATPAISDGRIYLRSDKHLYCVSDQHPSR